MPSHVLSVYTAIISPKLVISPKENCSQIWTPHSFSVDPSEPMETPFQKPTLPRNFSSDTRTKLSTSGSRWEIWRLPSGYVNPQSCGETTKACPHPTHPPRHQQYYQGDLKCIKSDWGPLEVRVQGMGAQHFLSPSRKWGRAWARMNVGQLSAAQLMLQAGFQLLWPQDALWESMAAEQEWDGSDRLQQECLCKEAC